MFDIFRLTYPKLIRDHKYYLVRNNILFPINEDMFIHLFKSCCFRYESYVTCTKFYDLNNELVLLHQYYRIKHYIRYDWEFERVMYGET